MAPISVEVDGKVIAKYERLPDELRAQLRHDLPDIMRDVKAAVAAKLVPGALFKTTTRLLPALSAEMVESKDEIYGRVFIDENKFPNVVAHTLESGSRPHEIVARLAPTLAFFWDKLGRMVFFKRVMHPGFPGRSYMQSTLDEMSDEIERRLSQSVVDTLND